MQRGLYQLVPRDIAEILILHRNDPGNAEFNTPRFRTAHYRKHSLFWAPCLEEIIG